MSVWFRALFGALLRRTCLPRPLQPQLGRDGGGELEDYGGADDGVQYQRSVVGEPCRLGDSKAQGYQVLQAAPSKRPLSAAMKGQYHIFTLRRGREIGPAPWTVWGLPRSVSGMASAEQPEGKACPTARSW